MNAVFETFKLRAEAVSAEVHRFPARTRLWTSYFTICMMSESAKRRRLVRYGHPVPSSMDSIRSSSPAVPGLSFDVNREASAEAKVGISQLDWAIANTGTLVQDAARVDQRLVSTLPLIHIALIRSDRLVPDLPSALTKSGRSRPITFRSLPDPAARPTSSACSPSACTARRSSSSSSLMASAMSREG